MTLNLTPEEKIIRKREYFRIYAKKRFDKMKEENTEAYERKKEISRKASLNTYYKKREAENKQVKPSSKKYAKTNININVNELKTII